jgi:hypothetical protein
LDFESFNPLASGIETHQSMLCRRRRSLPQGKTECQDVKFEAFAFIHPVPVHEKAVCYMNRENGDKHVTRNPECGNPAQATSDQAQRSCELS